MHEQRNKTFVDLAEGHQRMVLLARAMVKHPPLLILDEPTSGLDDEMAALFTSLVNKISEETSTAILYVSHKAEEGLEPGKIFTLSPGDLGSTGQIAG
jgi:molybdate transport system ATP-binding protein